MWYIVICYVCGAVLQCVVICTRLFGRNGDRSVRSHVPLWSFLDRLVLHFKLFLRIVFGIAHRRKSIHWDKRSHMNTYILTWTHTYVHTQISTHIRECKDTRTSALMYTQFNIWHLHLPSLNSLLFSLLPFSLCTSQQGERHCISGWISDPSNTKHSAIHIPPWCLYRQSLPTNGSQDRGVPYIHRWSQLLQLFIPELFIWWYAIKGSFCLLHYGDVSLPLLDREIPPSK